MKMKTKYLLLTLLSVLLLSACGSQTGYVMREDPEQWARLEGDAYMQKTDTALTSYSDVWSYSVSFLAREFEELYQLTREKKYRDMFTDYMDFFVSDSAIWGYKISEYNLERIQPARNLFLMYQITKEERYRNAIHYFITQLEQQPRTEEGGFCYRKIYPGQMWLESAYMACPFMAQYAKEFNEPAWFDEAVKQIELLYEKNRDPKTGLLFHGWDSTKTQDWADPETGRSPSLWGRAMGWFCAGVVDVLDYLPADHPSRERLITILNEVASAVIAVQDPEYNLWYQVLDQGSREGNFMEMSCTQLFIYTLAKGARLGYLPAEYRDIAAKAYDHSVRMMTKWYVDGSGILNVYYISGTCGLGQYADDDYRDGTYEYYTNVKTVFNDPKGTAPFLAASLELCKK